MHVKRTIYLWYFDIQMRSQLMCNAHTEVCTPILDIVFSLSISTFENIIPQCLRMYLNLTVYKYQGNICFAARWRWGAFFVCALHLSTEVFMYTKTSLRIVSKWSVVLSPIKMLLPPLHVFLEPGRWNTFTVRRSWSCCNHRVVLLGRRGKSKCVIPLINFPLSQTIMMQLHSSVPNLEYGTFFSRLFVEGFAILY